MIACIRRSRYQAALPLLAIVTVLYLVLTWRPTSTEGLSALSWPGKGGTNGSPSYNKTIVVASLNDSDTRWVQTDLPEYYMRAIYSRAWVNTNNA